MVQLGKVVEPLHEATLASAGVDGCLGINQLQGAEQGIHKDVVETHVAMAHVQITGLLQPLADVHHQPHRLPQGWQGKAVDAVGMVV